MLLEDVKEYYAQEKKDTCIIRKAFDFGGTPFQKGMVSVFHSLKGLLTVIFLSIKVQSSN